MSRIRAGGRRRQQVRVGAPDRSLTANAGLAAVTELCDRLGVIEALDAAVGVPVRPPPPFRGCPGDPAALIELGHVVLPHGAAGERHGEHITHLADALPGGGGAQVVVAVPARLLRRIRDQLEDLLRPGRDLAAAADHARRLVLSSHSPIQAPDQRPQPPDTEAASAASQAQWLARHPGCLGVSLEDFAGHPAYGIQHLRDDLNRFIFLLGGLTWATF